MAKTLGSYTVRALESLGVRHVFGIPGVHNLELYRSLHGGGAGSSITHVAARHEQGLGFMADGYARVARRVGVCFTITGPGLTNIATAMAQAYADSIPMLVISTEVAESERGRGGLHELKDQQGIAALLTAASERVSDPAQLPDALWRAFTQMSQRRPRPSYIGISRDLLTMDAEHLPLPKEISHDRPFAGAADVAEAARLLASAKAPLVLAGGGALGAVAELRRLVETIGAPLVMTVNGRGLLPPDHPLAVPMSPSLRVVRAAIASADVVLAVGTELGPTDYNMFGTAEFPEPARFIRIDVDEGQLAAPSTLGLCADASQTLRAILAQPFAPDDERTARGETRAAATRAEVLSNLPTSMTRQLALLALLRDRVPQAIFVGDSTQPVYAGNLAFAAATPGSWFNSATGYGTLGYALPAASGASVAAPDRPIVCVIGDGGIQFSLGELAVPRELGAWMAIVVWNNGGYGEIKASMQELDISPTGVDLQPPDFRLVASAYGYEHVLVDDIDALERACRDFASRRTIMLIEVQARAFE